MRHDLEGDHAEHGADGAALLEHVHAEAAQAGHPVGQVDLVALLELLLLELIHDPEGHARDLFGGQPLAVLQGHQLAVDPEHRGKAGLQVDVGRAAPQRDGQNLVQLHARESTTLLPPSRESARLG